jgi:hypothetical protein
VVNPNCGDSERDWTCADLDLAMAMYGVQEQNLICLSPPFYSSPNLVEAVGSSIAFNERRQFKYSSNIKSFPTPLKYMYLMFVAFSTIEELGKSENINYLLCDYLVEVKPDLAVTCELTA